MDISEAEAMLAILDNLNSLNSLSCKVHYTLRLMFGEIRFYCFAVGQVNAQVRVV